MTFLAVVIKDSSLDKEWKKIRRKKITYYENLFILKKDNYICNSIRNLKPLLADENIEVCSIASLPKSVLK